MLNPDVEVKIWTNTEVKERCPGSGFGGILIWIHIEMLERRNVGRRDVGEKRC